MTAITDVIANNTSRHFQEYAYNDLTKINVLIPFFDSILKPIYSEEGYLVLEDELRSKYLGIIWDRMRFLYNCIEHKDFDAHYAAAYWKATQNHILELWKSSEISSDTKQLEGVFVNIFDDLIKTTMAKMPDVTVKKLGNFRHLYRASKHCPFDAYRFIMPDPQYCRDNRWNDDGVAFLYLSYDNDNSEYKNIRLAQKTCFEELRLEANETVAVCEFQPDNPDAKILDLTYKGLNLNQLMSEVQTPPNGMKDDIWNEIVSSPCLFEKMKRYAVEKNEKAARAEFDRIRKMIGQDEKIKDYVLQRIPYLILGNICEAIFYAVDKATNPSLDAYIPFRKFSKYLISKGYNGVAYKSTRMELIGLEGFCLTVFNPADIKPINGTMEVYEYDGVNYTLIKRY